MVREIIQKDLVIRREGRQRKRDKHKREPLLFPLGSFTGKLLKLRRIEMRPFDDNSLALGHDLRRLWMMNALHY